METRRIYCLVPLELAGRLHDQLHRHFAEEAEIDIVVERRRGERRTEDERRAAEAGEAFESDERRRVRNAGGRRIGERRATVVELSPDEAPELPRRARRFADRIAFVERLQPGSEQLEDDETARLVTRIQAGERELFSEIYLRYFSRVYGYLRVLLKDAHEAEDASQQVFTKSLEGIDRYERRRQPFRAWLFVVARNTAVDTMKRAGRLDVLDPAELGRRTELENGGEATDEQLDVLRWIADRDLSIFIERLPLAQRQVLLLRFMLDMTDSQIAAVLDMSAAHVRMLQSRALGFLRERLTALGRAPKRTQRSRLRRSPRHATVLRSRRWALLP